MAKYKITAPNAQYSGVSAGVRFDKGTATIEGDDALAEYLVERFERNGYTVEKIDEPLSDPHDVDEIGASTEPYPVALTDAEQKAQSRAGARAEAKRLLEAEAAAAAGTQE